MILYFSGTGNSQYVAVKIAEIIGDGQVFSINRAVKMCIRDRDGREGLNLLMVDDRIPAGAKLY